MGLRKNKSLVDQAIDQATEYVDALRPHVEAVYGQAKDYVQDTAMPALSEARDKAAPVVATGATLAVAKATSARDLAAPLLASGATLAAEKAGAARELADAKVAQLKGEEPQKKGRLKQFVLVAALAGGIAVVAKKLQGGGKSDNWQSTYKPAPAPAPRAAASSATAKDPAGAGPGEAIADAAETPHPVTTPDEPAEVIEIDPGAHQQ